MSDEADLGEFALPDEAILVLKKANGEPSAWCWRMAGPGHEATISADDRQMKYWLERSDEQERARAAGRKWNGVAQTPDGVHERQVDYIVARTLGWTGGPVPFSAENAKNLLADKTKNFYDQANDFLRDERAFTKGSPKP